MVDAGKVSSCSPLRQDINHLQVLGCYTCKDHKKKCDCIYTFYDNTTSQSCNSCSKLGIACHLTKPDEWANDPAQAKAQQDERKRLVRLKRKSREESDSSGRASRDRSVTVRPDFSMHHSSVYRSIEKGF
jgi:hypothetical protein